MQCNFNVIIAGFLYHAALNNTTRSLSLSLYILIITKFVRISICANDDDDGDGYLLWFFSCPFALFRTLSLFINIKPIFFVKPIKKKKKLYKLYIKS